MKALRSLVLVALTVSLGAFVPRASAHSNDDWRDDGRDYCSKSRGDRDRDDRDGDGKKVTFMTRNLYLGADLTPAIGAILFGTDMDVLTAVGSVWGNVQATDFPTRAHAIAEEVKDEKPDFIGLQEAVMWTLTSPADGTTTVVYDFVEILRGALEARGMHYDVVGTENAFAAVVPGFVPSFPSVMYVGLQDRDVLLVKHGSDMTISNVSTHSFANILQVGPITETRGWVQADVKMGKREFRVVNTHLTNESPDYRLLQAGELVAPTGPCSTSLPVVLLGDFNSNGNTPDTTGTGAPYQVVRSAGFSDAWLEDHPHSPGLTFGQEPTLTVPAWPSTVYETVPQPVERIDFVLYRGGHITTDNADIFGKSVTDMYHGLWPSDHAGVAATLRIP